MPGHGVAGLLGSSLLGASGQSGSGFLGSGAMWLAIGFLGQAVFTARFLVQWVASERKRDSVVPVAFWWLSMAGGFILLSYAIHRQDPVIIVGQSMGVFIYVRNLMLVGKARRRSATRVLGAVPRPHVDTAATQPTA